jgi:hypothetical protein
MIVPTALTSNDVRQPARFEKKKSMCAAALPG